jgi:hypothetical protein
VQIQIGIIIDVLFRNYSVIPKHEITKRTPSFARFPFTSPAAPQGLNHITLTRGCLASPPFLFYTNDEGAYMVQFRDKTPDAVQEFQSLDDREKIIQSFRANTAKISDGRLGIPMVFGVTQPFKDHMSAWHESH